MSPAQTSVQPRELLHLARELFDAHLVLLAGGAEREAGDHLRLFRVVPFWHGPVFARLSLADCPLPAALCYLQLKWGTPDTRGHKKRKKVRVPRKSEWDWEGERGRGVLGGEEFEIEVHERY